MAAKDDECRCVTCAHHEALEKNRKAYDTAMLALAQQLKKKIAELDLAYANVHGIDMWYHLGVDKP